MEAEIFKDNVNMWFITSFVYSRDGTMYDMEITLTFKEITQGSIVQGQDNGTVYVRLIKQKLKEEIKNGKNWRATKITFL